MERWRERFPKKGKMYQQDVFSWCIQRRQRLLDSIEEKQYIKYAH